MTYYIITDISTQWFSYLISKDEEKIVEVFDMVVLNGVKSTLLDNIYGREPIYDLNLIDRRFVNNGGDFGGWSISQLEFDRISRLISLKPMVDEFNSVKDSV